MVIIKEISDIGKRIPFKYLSVLFALTEKKDALHMYLILVAIFTTQEKAHLLLDLSDEFCFAHLSFMVQLALMKHY